MSIGPHEALILLKCPKCSLPLLGYSQLELVDKGEHNPAEYPEFTTAKRVWPESRDNILNLSHDIPEDVRKALSEARTCYDAQAYAATVVMCGKAIESICVDKTGEKTIAKGLQKMKDEKIIDDKLLNWAEILRKERNLGAHATEHDTKQQDARDMLSFATAISEYVYVLSEKYDEYILRKNKLN